MGSMVFCDQLHKSCSDGLQTLRPYLYAPRSLCYHCDVATYFVLASTSCAQEVLGY